MSRAAANIPCPGRVAGHSASVPPTDTQLPHVLAVTQPAAVGDSTSPLCQCLCRTDTAPPSVVSLVSFQLYDEFIGISDEFSISSIFHV
jgi:hypothetical protein